MLDSFSFSKKKQIVDTLLQMASPVYDWNHGYREKDERTHPGALIKKLSDKDRNICKYLIADDFNHVRCAKYADTTTKDSKLISKLLMAR